MQVYKATVVLIVLSVGASSYLGKRVHILPECLYLPTMPGYVMVCVQNLCVCWLVHRPGPCIAAGGRVCPTHLGCAVATVRGTVFTLRYRQGQTLHFVDLLWVANVNRAVNKLQFCVNCVISERRWPGECMSENIK